ncbi:MAG: hypothetical protein KC684_05835 [Candidatus Omnitrophica bacterium]|nr:hypothetical protein [Candidatus Omnitrophota bacterium]
MPAKRNRCVWSCLLVLLGAVSTGFTFVEKQPGVITVFTNQERGLVNKKVFGNNVAGYDPSTYEQSREEYCGFSDFGGGLWDPELNRPVSEVLALMKEAGVSVLRFPGGCGTHHYDWKKTIGKDRSEFRFGLDEFLTVAREMGAESIITLSYFTGNAQTQADLVEYLNTPDDGSNPNGGADWAAVRAENGHPEPYGVRYFEIGNEVWHGDHRGIAKVTAKDYAEKYLTYYAALKAVDPDIQIGVVLFDKSWDHEVLGIIQDKLDFAIVHFYFSAGWAGKDLTNQDPKHVFADTLKEPERYQDRIRRKLMSLREAAGRDIPLAFTEYNTAFTQNEPLPYRHTLGSALVNAEIVKVLMNPENNILLANYWDALSRFWGMVYYSGSVDQNSLYNHYTKRPSFYVYQLYHHHFGDVLLKSTVSKQQADLSVNSSKNIDGDKVYIFVVNRNVTKAFESFVELEDFIPLEKVDAWTLDGTRVDALNEDGQEQVSVSHKTMNMQDGKFLLTFKPHSLTVLEFKRKN